MKNLLIISCFLLGLSTFSSCYNDKGDQLYVSPYGGGGATTCDTSSITYSGTIAPIMAQYCSTSGCHDAATQGGGYNYTNYVGLTKSITSGRLLGAINHESGYFAMPQNTSKLSACDINKITIWVNAGNPNN